MNRRFVCLIFLSLLSSGFSAAPAEEPPRDMQLFLLIGQSNMAGRGVVEPEDQVTNPHIFMQTKDRKWVPARDPVHFDKPEVDGVGPSMEFARTLLKKDPSITIGLIPCAYGGTSMRQWKPEGNSHYKWAVSRAKEALKNGALRGILWHQGESDTSDKDTAAYAERFSTMIAQLRKDLSTDVPVVIGELGHFRPYSEKFNAGLPNVAAGVPVCGYVTSEGLTDNGDTTHFDAHSQRILGRRYADVFLNLESRKLIGQNK